MSADIPPMYLLDFCRRRTIFAWCGNDRSWQLAYAKLFHQSRSKIRIDFDQDRFIFDRIVYFGPGAIVHGLAVGTPVGTKVINHSLVLKLGLRQSLVILILAKNILAAVNGLSYLRYLAREAGLLDYRLSLLPGLGIVLGRLLAPVHLLSQPRRLGWPAGQYLVAGSSAFDCKRSCFTAGTRLHASLSLRRGRFGSRSRS